MCMLCIKITCVQGPKALTLQSSNPAAAESLWKCTRERNCKDNAPLTWHSLGPRITTSALSKFICLSKTDILCLSFVPPSHPQSSAVPAPQRGQAATVPLTSASASYWPDLLHPAGQTEAPSTHMQQKMISEKKIQLSPLQCKHNLVDTIRTGFFSMGNSLLINTVCAIL